jgi:hypothetical protein
LIWVKVEEIAYPTILDVEGEERKMIPGIFGLSI